MKTEFYKMEYEAWDEGTDDLTLEQEGAYLRLCHQMYRRRGSIPINRTHWLVSGAAIRTRRLRSSVSSSTPVRSR